MLVSSTFERQLEAVDSLHVLDDQCYTTIQTLLQGFESFKMFAFSHLTPDFVEPHSLTVPSRTKSMLTVVSF